MIDPCFELGFSLELGGQYSWRLKEGELRYRGTREFAGLIEGRIPVSDGQIERFVAALDLLDTWNWRDDYHPQDVQMAVMDGGHWWFKAKLHDRVCHSAGENAYPSYHDPRQTTLNPERFDLLRAGLYETFQIEHFIYQARWRQQQAERLASDETSSQE